MIKKSNLECPPFGREQHPIDPILAHSIQPDRVQEIEEKGDHLHPPIMDLMKVIFH
jgi:hypothetical protein